jgi:hypothetical protein
MQRIASLLCLAGIVSLAAAAWLCHPIAGLTFCGLAALVLGVGMHRVLSAKP